MVIEARMGILGQNFRNADRWALGTRNTAPFIHLEYVMITCTSWSAM